MYCGNCGKKLNEGQDLCLNCGKYVSFKENINNNSSNNLYKNVVIISVVIALALMFLIFIVSFIAGITASIEDDAYDTLINSIEEYPYLYPDSVRVRSGNISVDEESYYFRVVGYDYDFSFDKCYKIDKETFYPQEFFDKDICNSYEDEKRYIDIDIINERLAIYQDEYEDVNIFY